MASARCGVGGALHGLANRVRYAVGKRFGVSEDVRRSADPGARPGKLSGKLSGKLLGKLSGEAAWKDLQFSVCWAS